jgi:cell division septation protein DedD
MTDDRAPEFHLDGKQLVFLVISGIGVAVVVFLCGVMVGRGVPAASARDTADPLALVDAATGDAGAPVDVPGTTGDVSLEPESIPFPDRTSSLRPPAPLGDPIASPPEAAAPAPRSPAPKAAAAAVPAAAGSGRFEVQVVSLRGEAEAQAVARRLKSKGYSAFVSETNQNGRMFRVRVGGFPDLTSAEAVRNRLKTEENFMPWVDTVH